MTEMTPEQVENAIALHMTLLEKLSPELYELKKIMDIYMPHIEYGEIHATFQVQRGKVVRVESYPTISRKIESAEK